jgi:prepilin-type N-terminal cleavage/methylation domain-containing protein
MRRFARVATDTRGVTLAELLVACAILAMIMAGLYGLTSSGATSFMRGVSQVEAQGSARAALQRMAAEVWASGYNPRDCPLAGGAPNGLTCFTTVSPLSAASATSFSLQSDLNGDGSAVAAQADEIITYSLNAAAVGCPGNTCCPANTCLQRQASVTDAAPQTIIGGVQSLTFTYFDQAGTVIAAPGANLANIRAVGIRIETRPEIQVGQWGNIRVVMNDVLRVRNR